MEESRRYKFTSYYYRLLSARLIFVVLFENVIATVTSLMRWIIPDVPQQLRQQMRQHAYLTNELILQQEFARAKEISDAEKMQAAKKKRMRAKSGAGASSARPTRGNKREDVSSAGSAAERASIDSVGVHTVVSFVHSVAMEQRLARANRVEASARERQSAYNSRKVNRSVADRTSAVSPSPAASGTLTPNTGHYLMKTVSVEEAEEEEADALEEEVGSANSRTAILSDDVVSLNTDSLRGSGGGDGGPKVGGGTSRTTSLTDGNAFYSAYLADASSQDQLIGGASGSIDKS